MPSERLEIWRYLDLDFDPRLDQAADGPGTSMEPDELLSQWNGRVVTVVDGFSITEGIETVVDAQDVGDDLFSTAYDALAPGAVVIDGSLLSEPVFVDVQVTGESTTFPGVHIDVPGGTVASIVIRLQSRSDAAAVVVPRLTGVVGDNARCDLTVIQDWNYGTRSLGRAVIDIGRDAGLNLTEVGLGAKIGRFHLDVNYVGDGSWAKINGVYFGEEDQTLDYRYFMNHIGRNTRSDMHLKGAVEDEALSVFTGMIRIETTGQKTEAFQTNRNLILTKGASAQSVPNLEILANDVKCGHGSSVGPLDEDQRYYLMSRGLTPDVADRLQVRGFFEEVIAEIPHADLAPWIRDRINAKYIAAQEEGRL
jgi:Fe-S cluster assembly protein SufD